MGRLLIGWILFFCLVRVVVADVALLPVRIDLRDHASLQRGAKLFMNYCSGCHSLHYMRYNRMADDLGLTTHAGTIDNDLLVNNLIFTEANPQAPIDISMPPVNARQWFGRLPPDLSLSARERGPNWLYTYLKSFYDDKNRPFGDNNLLVPDATMPNILASLEGTVIALKQRGNHHLYGQSHTQLVLVKPGEMSMSQFDSALNDLVNFLVYVAEPAKLIRIRIGMFVMLFLCLFLALAYPLKKLYWRDVSVS